MCIDVCICSVSFAISSVGAGHHVHVGAAGCGMSNDVGFSFLQHALFDDSQKHC